jgi:hypothetical protein
VLVAPPAVRRDRSPEPDFVELPVPIDFVEKVTCRDDALLIRFSQ